MKEEQILQIMAEVGPNAKDALDSWVSLQWAKFLMGYGFGFFVVALIAYGLYSLYKNSD